MADKTKNHWKKFYTSMYEIDKYNVWFSKFLTYEIESKRKK